MDFAVVPCRGELWDLQGRGAESLNLQDAVHKRIDGIVLISSVINFQAIAFDPGNDLSYILAFPSYVAAAWFHRQAPSL